MKRFNAYDKTTRDFIKEILVECPKCKKQARLISPGLNYSTDENIENETKLTCSHCYFVKQLSDIPRRIAFVNSRGKPIFYRSYALNGWVDPYFQQRLWLIQ